MILSPQNPVVAVIHPDPYPYYAGLAASRPIYWDETARLWIASSATAVTAVLTSDLCRVRPPTEQVPRALLGSSAADVFCHLVRMNDGQKHDPMKRAISATLQTLDIDQIAEQSRKWARFLVDEIEPAVYPSRLTDFAFQLPVYVVASLLGIPLEQLQQTAVWMSDFVRCLAPASSSEQIEQGKGAASHLVDLLHTTLGVYEHEHNNCLLDILVYKASSVGCADRDAVVANGIGLLSQAYEATAGLIGNTLLALARHWDVHEQVMADPNLLPLVIQEVLRYDPPIQNTRRYLSGDGMVAGEMMKEGDVVLVVVAAANWDPAANSEPERFDIFRSARRLFTFGAGVHGCPGEIIAAIIARAGVEQLILSGVNLPHLTATVSYRPSVNARIPLFKGEEL